MELSSLTSFFLYVLDMHRLQDVSIEHEFLTQQDQIYVDQNNRYISLGRTVFHVKKSLTRTFCYVY